MAYNLQPNTQLRPYFSHAFGLTNKKKTFSIFRDTLSWEPDVQLRLTEHTPSFRFLSDG